MNFMNGVHTTLLGDPTLKLHYVIPPRNLNSILKDSAHVNLTWSASGETVLGYNIYRKKINETNYTKINAVIVNVPIYDDSCVSSPDTFVYQVKAVVLESTPSGSYFNESLASTDTFYNQVNLKPLANFTITNTDPSFTFNNTSLRSISYTWTFSDTSLSFNTSNSFRTYNKNGNYWILLTSNSQCSSDTQKLSIKVTKGLPSNGSIVSNEASLVTIHPNPFTNSIQVVSLTTGNLRINSLDGKCILNHVIQSKIEVIDTENLPKGVYILDFTEINGRKEFFKLIKE